MDAAIALLISVAGKLIESAIAAQGAPLTDEQLDLLLGERKAKLDNFNAITATATEGGS